MEEKGKKPMSKGPYLGVRISLYCSFSTRVVAATDIGMTMLLMSNELSPLLLLTGCCKTKVSLKGCLGGSVVGHLPSARGMMCRVL